MKNWFNHISLLLPLGIYCILWVLLNPYLGYMLDSDCVAYLTIANRILHGQYLQSINGLWSPLNIWMIVPFMKNGMDGFEAAKLLNAFFGFIILIQVFFLFKKFKLQSFITFILMISSAITMAYFVYFQLFGDVLQLIFVLFYLFVLLSEKFYNQFWKVMLCGFVMAIAYYAKAYSLVFFFLHFGVVLLWAFKNNKITFSKGIQYYFIGVFTALLFVLPWTYALHTKYNEWSLTGHAGKLNMSWYINSGKTFKKDLTLLIPPIYEDSPSFWEDPSLTQDNLSSPFSSPKHFVKWIARVIHTSLVAIMCFNEISFLALAILIIGLFYFFFRTKDSYIQHFDTQIIILTILLLPLGYLMMHIETRYIWLNTFLLMVLGALLIQLIQPYFKRALFTNLASILLGLSFIVHPIVQFDQLKYKNKSLFELSTELKKHEFKGKFTSNVVDAGNMWVIAYLTQSQFYTIEKTDYTIHELKQEMNRYQVDQFIYSIENNIGNTLIQDSSFTLLYSIGSTDIYQFKLDK